MAKTNLFLERVGRAILGLLLVMNGVQLLDSTSASRFQQIEATGNFIARSGYLPFVNAELVTKAQGILMVMAGMVLTLTRSQGQLVAFSCFAFQTVTLESTSSTGDASDSEKRSTAINYLKLLILGLTCLLMHSKRQPVKHTH